MKMYTTATVRVTIEVPTDETWGPECTMKQIQEQASHRAKQMLEQHIAWRASETTKKALQEIAAMPSTCEYNTLDLAGHDFKGCEAKCHKCTAILALNVLSPPKRRWKIVDAMKVIAVTVEEA